MRKNLLIIISLFSGLGLQAQTFNGGSGNIPDFNIVATRVSFPCTVSGLPTSTSPSFGLERICLDITHTYDHDLLIQLTSPAHDTVTLCNRRGDGFNNFTATCFRGHSLNGLVSGGTAPFTGEFDPDGDLYVFMNGQNPNGTWYLLVTDLARVDSGTVNAFTLVFGNNPSPHSLVPCSTTDATLCKCPDGTQDCDLLPDMTASAAALTGSFERNDTVFVDNATPNIGWGPLEIHGIDSCFCDLVPVPCSTVACPGTGLAPKQLVKQTIYHKDHGSVTTWTRPAGTMTYHPAHGHIHLDGWASYTLRRPLYGLKAPDWPIVGEGFKQSYCLINLGTCTTGNGYCLDTSGAPLGPQQISNYGMGAVTGCTRDQGIFVGNYDVYSAALNGQWIVLDSLCNGDYYIVSITDPNNLILETNDNNNWASVPITLTHQLNRPFPTVNFTYSGAANTIDFVNSSSDYDSLIWDFGDGQTSNANNPSHSYQSTGTFIVVLTAFNKCGSQQHVESFTLTLVGISETASPDVYGFKVYPNPATTQVKVDFSLSKRSTVSLQLFDVMGNLIQTLSDETLNTGSHHYLIDSSKLNLAKGVYTIRLTSAETNSKKRIVFVK